VESAIALSSENPHLFLLAKKAEIDPQCKTDDSEHKWFFDRTIGGKWRPAESPVCFESLVGASQLPFKETFRLLTIFCGYKLIPASSGEVGFATVVP
jgi:hypothetical protein